MADKIRLILLEDHPGMVDGYRFRLAQARDIEIVAALSYGEEVEQALYTFAPVHLLLLDLNVPTSIENPNPYPALQLIPHLLNRHPDLQILIVSMHKERALIRAIVQAGAIGYIVKDDRDANENLASIFRSVARGGMYFSREAQQQLFRKATDTLPLSPRQLEALSLCAAYPDKSLADIAKMLGVADATVRNQLSLAYGKLQVQSRTALVEKARQLGFIPSPESYPVLPG